MLSLRWNQFENQSLSVPVPAHGLRRQVRQSLRSNRLTANPIFQFCYLKKTRVKLNYDANACPPYHQPARWPETTGWGTSWGASCSSSSAPTLPNLPQAIRLQAYDSTSDVTQPPAAVSGHKSCKVRDRINSNHIPVCTTARASSQAIESIPQPLPSFDSPFCIY